MTQPISDSAFAKLMAALGPFESAPHLAVAVSGGSDSLALLLLLKTWIDARQGRLTALSVDHGLRPEAAAECRQVGALIAAINAGHGQTTSGRAIAHEILTWQGAKPRHGVMAAARTARYRLLVAWCRAHDVLHLALGHHADDQAETVLMRQAHGSSTFGLAGMAGIRALGGVRLLRPLLSRRKTELTALVAAAGLAWIDDPSNASRRFERVRWRQELGPEADITAQLQQAATAGLQRDRLERQAGAMWAASGRIDPAGYVTFNLGRLLAGEDELSQLVLRQGLMMIGNSDFAPAPTAINRLLSRLRQQAEIKVTLGGCLIVARRGVLSLFREAASCEAPQPLVLAHPMIWDGRFVVTLVAGANGHGRGDGADPVGVPLAGGVSPLQVAAIGEFGLANLRLPDFLAALPYVARASLPGLWQGDNLLDIGRISGRQPDKAEADCSLRADFHRLAVCFRPSRPATSCGFTVVLPPRHTM